MVHESEEALNIIEDMMEEQIISTEDADLKTRAMVSSLQLLRGQVYESRDTEAVRTDLTCVEAMTSHQMLTLEEEILASETQPRTELSQLAGDVFIWQLSQEIFQGEAHQPSPEP